MAYTHEEYKNINKSRTGKNPDLKVLDRFKKSYAKSKALSKAKGGHKQGEREARSKKAGFYVAGHKNYGDVYEK